MKVKVHKIVAARDWEVARSSGTVPPAPVDVADGFIHLSADDQLLETARRHFAGRSDLVAIAFDAADLGPELRWEPSRGGDFFPHLYAALPAAKARFVRRLLPRADGGFDLGEPRAV